MSDNEKMDEEEKMRTSINKFSDMCEGVKEWKPKMVKDHAIKCANFMVREFDTYDFLDSIKTLLALNLCARSSIGVNGKCAANVKVTEKQGLYLISRAFQLASMYVKQDPELFFNSRKLRAARREKDITYFIKKSIDRALKDLFEDYKKHHYNEDISIPDSLNFDNEVIEDDAQSDGSENENVPEESAYSENDEDLKDIEEEEVQEEEVAQEDTDDSFRHPSARLPPGRTNTQTQNPVVNTRDNWGEHMPKKKVYNNRPNHGFTKS